MSFYQKEIEKILRHMRRPDIQPAHVEGYMRLPPKRRAPHEVDPTSQPGVYYVVERFTRTGWHSCTGSYKTAIEAQWARAKIHVDCPSLSISATRVQSWSWS